MMGVKCSEEAGHCLIQGDLGRWIEVQRKASRIYGRRWAWYDLLVVVLFIHLSTCREFPLLSSFGSGLEIWLRSSNSLNF